MAPKTLKRREAINILCRKTAFKKEKIESLMISLKREGNISFSYFKELVEMIRRQADNCAFNISNKAEWLCVERRLQETDLPAALFAEYFCTQGPEAARIRAQLMKPKISESQVKQFIADCLNRDISQLKDDTRINMLSPGYLQYDYNFYLTLLQWCEERFRKSPPPEMIEKGRLRDLTAFYATN